MIGAIEVLNMAQRLAEHAGTRQSVVAQNIAHANTPGYKQRDIPSFSETYGQGADGLAMRSTRRGHVAGATHSTSVEARVVEAGTVAPNGNSVSLENEILKSAEIKQQHDMALSIYRSGLSVIRASLGRR